MIKKSRNNAKVVPSRPILNNSACFANPLLGGEAITRQHPVALTVYFNDNTNLAKVLRSASLTCGLGGIAIAPHTPLPPLAILSTSRASAPESPRYLAATSLKAGPTTFLSTAWHARQLFFLANCMASASETAGSDFTSATAFATGAATS